MRLYEAQKVAFSEDNQVVQDLAPERAYEALRVSVLPGRPGRGLELPDTRLDTRALNAAP